MGGTGRERPVFVVGCPRSGTTLLQVMLHSHPRIAIPPETRFVVPAYRDRERLGDLRDPAARRAVAEWIVGDRRTRFGDLGLPAADVVERVARAGPTVGSVVGTVLAAYAERFGKPRWGDKRPAYWRDLDVILRMFPDAQIIHLVRDGRACVASLLRMPWWKGGFYGAVATWRMALRRCRRFGRRLGSQSYIEIHYEDLVSDPDMALRRLCAFLGEDYDAAMARPELLAGDVVPERKRWHRRTRSGVDPSRIESWQRELEPWQIGLIELVCGRELRRQGYALSGTGRRPTPRQLASYLADEGRRRYALTRDAVTDWRLRRRLAIPVAYQPAPGVETPVQR
jgi:LPS sulfotransferase NodH